MNAAKIRKSLFILVALISLVVVQATYATGSKEQGGSTTAQTQVDPFAKYDPPITIKIGYAPGQNYDFNPGETPNNNAWKDLYATFGINIQVSYVVDISQQDIKLRNAVASGDYPDILPLKPVDYESFAQTGVLADITDLFAKYEKAFPYLEYYVNTDGGNALSACYINGKLYGIPFLTNPYDYVDMLWIRTDWLKNLNLPLPKTMDDVEKLAAAFTNDDPDRNGKNDTYGLALAGKTVYTTEAGLGGFFAGFGAFPGFYNYGANIYIKNPNGSNLIWGGDLPGMKQALTMLQRMYKAGTIASDFVTMDSAKVIEEIQAGKAGMYFGPTWENYMVYQVVKNNPKADFIQIPIPTQTPGVPAKPFLRNSLSYVQAISSKTKHPEALLKMWALVASKMNSADINDIYKYFAGKSGGTYEYYLSGMDAREPLGSLVTNKDLTGALSSKDPASLKDARGRPYYDAIVGYDKSIADGTYDPVKNDNDVQNWLLKKMWGPGSSEDTVAQLKAKNSVTPSMYSGPQTKAITDYSADLTTLTTTEMLKIITGQLPVSDWDNLLKQYYAQGGTAILKDVNDWYNARKK